MLLMEGKRIVSLLRQKGLKSEIVGGIYKKKEDIHDIDLIVRRKDAEKDIVILKYSDIDCPVKLYVVNDRQYDRLKNALRSTTYENILGKKMRGLRYNKIKIDDL
jgi:hypothetical protein